MMMIRDTNGRYWLETTDREGRRRSSYLGNIGGAVSVEIWCQRKGIEFRQVRRSERDGNQVVKGKQDGWRAAAPSRR